MVRCFPKAFPYFSVHLRARDLQATQVLWLAVVRHHINANCFENYLHFFFHQIYFCGGISRLWILSRLLLCPSRAVNQSSSVLHVLPASLQTGKPNRIKQPLGRASPLLFYREETTTFPCLVEGSHCQSTSPIQRSNFVSAKQPSSSSCLLFYIKKFGNSVWWLVNKKSCLT